MTTKKGLAAIVAMLGTVLLCSLSLPQDDEKPKNLKVMPKNSTHEQVDSVMHSFKLALGVKCGFCHAPQKDDPRRLDFASDENRHKDIARDMMRMTGTINKKYFSHAQDSLGHAILAVSCVTCHNGHAAPQYVPDEPMQEEHH
ncbi:Photosynthetic reaction center cytochrome C subunit [Chitinophaga costaii]|uniref:Photosynthetic reaction center cytochrome c subunit n=1 Tax=Chitinophaga costaii TaxID=1335309 RepID=A0A1C3YZ20_9BACT|nr:c-type cytochrome [Chitinophaga costaii]PUZ30165.1 c-type cytochrome [Chitinophaga costaii]SCB75397.1 Photosynthetic reaction center cytochrome C subunit [Chitinophaga costaii]